ncbi:hypothetical protein HYALB_00010818 [Hymenoscyphus albidus]|uniref:C2H2-type domain-containing protein n=1 Tax=Hymenoscyphus albidus TaxID=595503 RepID=A0A9N9LP31_9HELO|nr:hypothetical protein HYALB_00010818 [Hymenoscyphus albidus]
METQSFTARRSAASNLPTFQLPPPDHLSGMQKYPAYAPSSAAQHPPVSSVLTPPATLPNDNSPLSSLNSGSSGSSAGGVPPYQSQSMGYWPSPQAQNTSYTYSSAPPMVAPYAQQQQQQQNYMNGRPLYSPSMNFQNRSTNSPASGDGLPPPPYDISLPPFPTSMSSSGGQQQNLPTLAPQQHQQHQNQQQQPQAAQPPPQQMNNHGLVSPQSASQAPNQGPLHAPEYGGRAPPTPGYYTPSSTPQQSSFPTYNQHSPTQQSPPNSSSAPASRISPVAASQAYQARPYGGGFNLPAMTGPIMSNIHNPGSQMAMVGGLNMPYGQHQMGAPMYAHHPQQPAQNDRPFKCDVCPQQFNRNHDLKRHKRIHLSVKPFPCHHCEKSFSRKDALKRHILVKGCGKENSTNSTNGESQSPVEKSEVMSDSTEGHGSEVKKELR